MRFLRNVVDYQRQDRKRITDIRKELDIVELNTEIIKYKNK